MPGDQSVIKSAYGEWSRFLANGMTGHRKGKIAIRRQTKLLPRIHELHWPIKGEDSRDQPVQSSELPPFTKIVETKLLHFEGWTALQWAAKLLRFVDDNKLNYHHAGRRAAIEFMAQNSEPAKRRQLFERVQRLTPHAFEVLKRHDLLRAAPFDPSICAVELFPEIDFDFSVQAFDSRLRAANPDFYVRTGM